MVTVAFVSIQGKVVTYAATMEQAVADVQNFTYFGRHAEIIQN